MWVHTHRHFIQQVCERIGSIYLYSFPLLRLRSIAIQNEQNRSHTQSSHSLSSSPSSSLTPSSTLSSSSSLSPSSTSIASSDRTNPNYRRRNELKNTKSDDSSLSSSLPSPSQPSSLSPSSSSSLSSDWSLSRVLRQIFTLRNFWMFVFVNILQGICKCT